MDSMIDNIIPKTRRKAYFVPATTPDFWEKDVKGFRENFLTEDEIQTWDSPAKEAEDSKAHGVGTTNLIRSVSGSILEIQDDETVKCLLSVNEVEMESYIPEFLFELADVPLEFGQPFFLKYGEKTGYQTVYLEKDETPENTPEKKRILNLIDQL